MDIDALAAIGHPAMPSAAHLQHCNENASQCEVTGNGKIEMAPETLALIKYVNRSVNRRIRPRPDYQERWTLNPTHGDCEDYAVTKRAELLRHGFPSSALLLAIVMARGQRHAVLIARTTGGDFVLDNLTNQVKRLRKRIVKMQSPHNPRRWLRGRP